MALQLEISLPGPLAMAPPPVLSTALLPILALTALTLALLTTAASITRRLCTTASAAIQHAPAPCPATQSAIDKLHVALPPGIVLERDDPSFPTHLRTYWTSQAQAAIPAAFIRPTIAAHVSTAIAVLAAAARSVAGPPPFTLAVRAGGQSPAAGFAGAANGLVLDLGALNDVRVSADRARVTVGMGARWARVYQVLDPLGLAVAGGRSADVGVGGLALGGGLSFFSSRVGFVCDGVESFEVVLADGRLVTASDASHPELLMALRGGGNNFGVVVSMTAKTFAQGKLFTGSLYHYPRAAPQLLAEWFDFCNPQSKTHDKSCTGMIAFGFAGRWQAMVPLSMLQSTAPGANPAALARFRRLGHWWSTMKMRSMAQAAADIQGWSPSGFRHYFCTTTFRNDLATMQHVFAAYQQSLARVKRIRGVIWSLVFQPIFPAATAYHAHNAMGLQSDDTLTVVLLAATWDNQEDDATVFAAAEALLADIEAFARKQGTWHPFKYVNYAGATQQPYHGFAEGRLQWLRDVSERYDPQRFFQRVVAGGFKLE